MVNHKGLPRSNSRPNLIISLAEIKKKTANQISQSEPRIEKVLEDLNLDFFRMILFQNEIDRNNVDLFFSIEL